MESNRIETGIGNLTPPRKSATIDALLKVNNIEHPIAKKYLEEYDKYLKQMKEHFEKFPKKEAIILPDLKPIDVESLYDVFKSAFQFFNDKPFNENANNSEGRKLARTLIAYFLNKKNFLKSPIIYSKLNEPSLEKGLLIIGGFGCGKTSIIKTFHQMFQYAVSNPIIVKDIEGTDQFLGRYKLGFPFYTTNDVVDAYEKISEKEEKDIFWKRHNFGFKYYDDLMTERTASNYGKVEIFKDILEKRYSNNAKTMASMNYSGNSVEETLDAISDKYGERVYDRIFEMFNIIDLHGKSLRK